MVYTAIKKLVQYGLETGLITETDRIYATNQILEALKLEEYEEPQDTVGTGNLEDILKELLDYACEQGIIENSIAYRDLFDAKLMNCLMPRPSEVEHVFWTRYQAVSYTHLDGGFRKRSAEVPLKDRLSRFLKQTQ